MPECGVKLKARHSLPSFLAGLFYIKFFRAKHDLWTCSFARQPHNHENHVDENHEPAELNQICKIPQKKKMEFLGENIDGIDYLLNLADNAMDLCVCCVFLCWLIKLRNKISKMHIVCLHNSG